MLSDPICLRVQGPFACFTMPEFHVERVSYPAITPSAACGILEAILMKPSQNPNPQRVSTPETMKSRPTIRRRKHTDSPAPPTETGPVIESSTAVRFTRQMKPHPLQLEISGPTAMWTRPDTGFMPRPSGIAGQVASQRNLPMASARRTLCPSPIGWERVAEGRVREHASSIAGWKTASGSTRPAWVGRSSPPIPLSRSAPRPGFAGARTTESPRCCAWCSSE